MGNRLLLDCGDRTGLINRSLYDCRRNEIRSLHIRTPDPYPTVGFADYPRARL